MRILKSDILSVSAAAEALKKGGVVIVPTDTIYGFSGIVPETDSKIRALKGREETKPFIQLIAEPPDIFKYTEADIPERLLKLWPCALTIIVSLTCGGTAAFRCPDDDWLRQVIAGCGKPIYSTSVNRSGSAPLWRIADIEDCFGSSVALIVDSGDIAGGVPSTLIDISKGSVTVLRQGAVKI